jgi:hypothetical protein
VLIAVLEAGTIANAVEARAIAAEISEAPARLGQRVSTRLLARITRSRMKADATMNRWGRASGARRSIAAHLAPGLRCWLWNVPPRVQAASTEPRRPLTSVGKNARCAPASFQRMARSCADSHRSRARPRHARVSRKVNAIGRRPHGYLAARQWRYRSAVLPTGHSWCHLRSQLAQADRRQEGRGFDSNAKMSHDF